MSSKPQQALAAELSAQHGSDWDVLDMTDGLRDNIAGRTLYIEQGGVSAYQNTPNDLRTDQLLFDFTLTIASRRSNSPEAVDEITDSLIEMKPILDGSKNIYWSEAERYVLTNSRAAYVLNIRYLYTIKE